MEADFKLRGVNIVYDVHYELEDNKNGDATFLLRHDDVSFTLRMFRKHNAEVESSVQYQSINSVGRGQWEMSVKTHPNTPQVQIMARTVRKKINMNCHTNENVVIIFFPLKSFVEILHFESQCYTPIQNGTFLCRNA